MQNKEDKIIKITRDKSAGLRKLRKFERQRLIEINEIKLENMPKTLKKDVLPVGVFGHTKWGECVYASDNCKYGKIRQIIGQQNVKDAINLEAHLRNGFDYFITEDTHFIKDEIRAELELEFTGLSILTTNELENLLNAK